MAPPAAADRESGGDRMLSWLDEDDPERDTGPYVPLVLPPPEQDDPPPTQARRSRRLPRPRRSKLPPEPPPPPALFQPLESPSPPEPAPPPEPPQASEPPQANMYERTYRPNPQQSSPYQPGPPSPPHQPQPADPPDPLDLPDPHDPHDPPSSQDRQDPPRRSRKFLVVMAGLVAVVVAAAVVAAGTAYRLIFDRGPAPTDRVATAALGDRREAAFDLVTGTTSVTVRSADLGADLYRIVTPRGSDILPRPILKGGEVDLHLVPSGEEGPGAVDVLLTSRVSWQLRLTGGAVNHVVDMRAGKLTGLELVGGATRAELTLPRPTGTVPIRMTGGVNQFLIHAPAGVLTRVRVGSGANSVNLDRLTETQIAPGTVFTPDGWARGRTRYDIDAAAGVATIRLDRTR
jgi:hypothetical protein